MTFFDFFARISWVMGFVWKNTANDFFLCFFSFLTMQLIFCMIFLLYYCTAVKTVKCTIQRTSSAVSLRKPFCKTCRCAHVLTRIKTGHFVTHSATQWVTSLITTRDSRTAYVQRRILSEILEVPSHRIRNPWNRVVKRGCANVEIPRFVYRATCRQILNVDLVTGCPCTGA